MKKSTVLIAALLVFGAAFVSADESGYINTYSDLVEQVNDFEGTNAEFVEAVQSSCFSMEMPAGTTYYRRPLTLSKIYFNYAEEYTGKVSMTCTTKDSLFNYPMTVWIVRINSDDSKSVIPYYSAFHRYGDYFGLNEYMSNLGEASVPTCYDYERISNNIGRYSTLQYYMNNVPSTC